MTQDDAERSAGPVSAADPAADAAPVPGAGDAGIEEAPTAASSALEGEEHVGALDSEELVAEPAPEEHVALPAPEELVAEPAPEEHVALPAPEELVAGSDAGSEAGFHDVAVAAEGPSPEGDRAPSPAPVDGPPAETTAPQAETSQRETSPPGTPQHEIPEPAAAVAVAADADAGPRTVGQFIADALRAAGVRQAFTVPGESFLGILDGLQRAGIRVVTTRHEGGAAFMAEAHGQLTGRPAVALGTRGVGAANLAIGIHTARQDSAPMFVLVGQVARSVRGREAFQEIDQPGTIGGLAVHAAELSSVEDVPSVLGDAVRAALTGRPGPAFLSVPEDLIDAEVPAGTALDTSRPTPARPEPNEIRTAIQFLATARRPLILAGGGVLRARTSSELVRFAELLRVPVIAGWRRADVLPNDHPLYLGMAGYGSPSSVRERLEAADALLVLGCRLSEITSFGYRVPARGQRWMHVDIEPLGERSGLPSAETVIRSDARVFLRSAVSRLQQGVLDAASADERQEANAADRARWEAATTVDDVPWTGPGVHPAHTIATVGRVVPDDAIVTTDAGNFGLWVARYFRFRRPGTFLGPTSGAMGYALPAAIAAALIHRDRTVVAFAGDGGFAMTMAELETAVREKAKVVAIVFDNERYGTIRMHQDRRGPASEAVNATDLGPVDFAAIARACGARGIRVETDAAFEQALRQAMANDRPTVVQVTLDRGWTHPDEPFAGTTP